MAVGVAGAGAGAVAAARDMRKRCDKAVSSPVVDHGPKTKDNGDGYITALGLGARRRDVHRCVADLQVCLVRPAVYMYEYQV